MAEHLPVIRRLAIIALVGATIVAGATGVVIATGAPAWLIYAAALAVCALGAMHALAPGTGLGSPGRLATHRDAKTPRSGESATPGASAAERGREAEKTSAPAVIASRTHRRRLLFEELAAREPYALASPLWESLTAREPPQEEQLFATEDASESSDESIGVQGATAFATVFYMLLCREREPPITIDEAVRLAREEVFASIEHLDDASRTESPMEQAETESPTRRS